MRIDHVSKLTNDRDRAPMRFSLELEERRIFSPPIEDHREQGRGICGASASARMNPRRHVDVVQTTCTPSHFLMSTLDCHISICLCLGMFVNLSTAYDSNKLQRGIHEEQAPRKRGHLALKVLLPWHPGRGQRPLASVSRRLLLLALGVSRKGLQRRSEQGEGNVCHRSGNRSGLGGTHGNTP